jgi:hypothetical protein
VHNVRGSALASGAAAVQVGSALLLSTEAGTSPPHREALLAPARHGSPAPFTGRRARGIVNRFMLEHDAFAPRAYPELHHMTAPIRAAARAQEMRNGINLSAGTAYRGARVASALELVERWTHARTPKCRTRQADSDDRPPPAMAPSPPATGALRAQWCSSATSCPFAPSSRTHARDLHAGRPRLDALS